MSSRHDPHARGCQRDVTGIGIGQECTDLGIGQECTDLVRLKGTEVREDPERLMSGVGFYWTTIQSQCAPARG
jgi:hypothetical protein